MNPTAIVLLQILTGLGLLAHGVPKLLELRQTMKWFAKQGYGVIVGVFTALVETLGAFLLIVGLFPRIVAGFVAITMLGAMFHHWRNKESFTGGWEASYLYFVTSIVIVLTGIGWV